MHFACCSVHCCFFTPLLLLFFTKDLSVFLYQDKETVFYTAIQRSLASRRTDTPWLHKPVPYWWAIRLLLIFLH
jgi:hypothetical protein